MGGKRPRAVLPARGRRRGAGRLRAGRSAAHRTSSARCGARSIRRPRTTATPTDNNWRFFRSRSGHLLKFDDTAGAERIEIIGKGGDHKLVIDVSGRKIEITCSSGDVAISAPAGQGLDRRQRRSRSSAKTSMTLDGGAVADRQGRDRGHQLRRCRWDNPQRARAIASWRIDMHLIQPPGPTSPVPVPHPFTGVIDGGVSADVTIGGVAGGDGEQHRHQHAAAHPDRRHVRRCRRPTARRSPPAA